MALILNIDTATENASICLAQNGNVLALAESTEQKNHASFLQTAIQKVLIENSVNINELDAIAITNGPGSYTGLRVGLASAKGICYALNKPLITLNTLQVMAWAAREEGQQNNLLANANLPVLFCPMIDARRMEVFTALFNQEMTEVLATTSMILDERSFDNYLKKFTLVFSGNGCSKIKNILKNSNAWFFDCTYSAASMVDLSEFQYSLKSFAVLAYSEPFYAKEFYNLPPKKSYIK